MIEKHVMAAKFKFAELRRDFNRVLLCCNAREVTVGVTVPTKHSSTRDDIYLFEDDDQADRWIEKYCADNQDAVYEPREEREAKLKEFFEMMAARRGRK
jgi:hypothetical protein